jgi:hypothetical protein
MRIGVRQRAETIVILLTSRIPKGQLDVLSINLNVGDVVLENSGDVDLNESKLSACIHLLLDMCGRD